MMQPEDFEQMLSKATPEQLAAFLKEVLGPLPEDDTDPWEQSLAE
jgi:hypothetical protein